MQFQVPQFIEVEDKIIGPLTIKQFIYLGVAGGFAFILFFVLQTWLWVICTAILATLAASLAFIKYNGRPMINMLLSASHYAWQPKFYLWHRTNSGVTLPTVHALPKEKHAVAPLKNLWLQMNTSKQAVEKREKFYSALAFFKRPKEIMENYEVVQKTEGDQELMRRVDYR